MGWGPHYGSALMGGSFQKLMLLCPPPKLQDSHKMFLCMKCRFLQKLSLQSYETSINQKATIRITPRTLKTSKDYHGCQFLALNFEKKFKKKDFKTVFTSGANLKSILCQNKSKPVPNCTYIKLQL